ncbi:hypothetical protein H5P28_09485 [Ruficoccus amylovorans]|uniref:PEP-CTERM sorting domain-containing protein n=1 Tax=Ruficoccus amylovorans TaxID=1804625 RepID=A0A842HD51_9BACT|nr:hypothetical protein [Ruficoccus amylovorans]MBC2592742.1 hypothetical protein [Ruficoccus amylovorans]MBC2593517.1 hypothetical protein [Ruficoccus amylovorans]MBC2594480.1 hypothetical protein [Ruficoccus amylovorans]MBC2594488.1 hypothetical protein [Ruficoccus amylovorans]
MKFYSIRTLALTASAAMLPALTPLSAATVEGASVYIDFGSTLTPEAGFTELSVAATGAVAFYEQSLSNLEDSAGNLTGSSFLLNVSNGTRNVAGSNSSNDHDPVPGIPVSATTDGIWFNNQNTGTAGGEAFGFTLTFSDLDDNYAYNIMVLMGDGTTTDFLWQIATGSGDPDSITITSSDAVSAVATWTSVTPTDGTIVITGLAAGPLAGSNTGRLNLVSLTAVNIPETSSATYGIAALIIASLFSRKIYRRKR